MTQYGYGSRRGFNPRWIIALVIALVGVVGYFAKEKVTNPETGESYRRAMNVDQQKALGLQAAKEMIPKMGGAADPSRDPDGRIVSEVGTRVVSETGASKTEFAGNFNFYLVEDPNTINAFALPGGQISITRGLYNRLENEAQLAGVLGHEVGHVIAEHSAQQMAKGQLGQMIATAVGVGASGEDGRGRYAGVAAMMANQMLQLKYTRGDETQADEIGLKYMKEAGYDPAEMVAVMEILKSAAGGSRQPEILSSHPLPESRIEDIKRWIESHQGELKNLKLTKGQPLHGR
jgi:predicted Zn-dependent protease